VRSHHIASDDEDTFTIAPAVAYMMIGAGIFLFLVPFILPGAAGDISNGMFCLYLSPFWLGVFTASVWFLRYKVVVRDDTLRYGAFRQRVVPFSEVIDIDVLNGQKSSELWVYLKNGKKLKFSGLLSDFYELVGMIDSHMAGLPEPQRDSPAKMQDRVNRRRDNRMADWFMIVGVLIVAAFLVVLWRTQLLQ
jgi:hypothetical protein